MTARHPLFQPLIWNAEADALLSSGLSDRAVAKQLGVHRKTVAARRERLGIPAHNSPHVWTAAEDAQLGAVSDSDIGRRLKLDPETVQRRRKALGIAPYRTPRRVLVIVCAICGKKTQVANGRRRSQLRRTCLPPHRFTRAGRLSECHKQLISRTLMVTGKQPTSARRLVKNMGGSSVIRLLDD